MRQILLAIKISITDTQFDRYVPILQRDVLPTSSRQKMEEADSSRTMAQS
jgi:hypothetical protein